MKTKRGYIRSSIEIKNIEFELSIDCIGRVSNYGIGDYEFWGVPQNELNFQTELDSFGICEIRVKGKNITKKIRSKCPNIYNHLLDFAEKETEDISQIEWIEDYY